ncbi:unnamed protein product [Larinioides sclopetarius]|uniref:EGF-like domain-containing protein n=1 Tax=Larinioides sclopetarius TaxID=280406 RepID=A0AAV2AFX8_9ARAC
MKYFPLLLVLFFELLYQNGLGRNLNSRKNLFKEKGFNLYNEAYSLENDVFEDPLEMNAGCSCTNGECVNEGGKDVCKCPPGYGNYTNSYCKACECGPNEICIGKNTGWFSTEMICFCNTGYVENNGKCIADLCSSNPCNNGGTCTFSGNNFTCSCVKPYAGLTCETNPCTPNLCQNEGICSVVGQDLKCSCKSPFKGNFCEIGPCSSNPCQNGGKCSMDGKNFKCECKPPFKGKNCEIDPCTPNPCQNEGICSVVGQDLKCSCKSPFKGNFCETGPCSSNPCMNYGKCKLVGMNYKCDCPPPYEGKQCEKDPCFSSPCRNGGTCKITGNTYTCDCPQDYVGDKCQYDCDCKKGKCRITSDKDVVCECLPEYGKNSGVCEACNCGNGANCTFESDFWGIRKTKYCLCPDGSKLVEQHCGDPCRSNPCLNNGKCKVEGKNFKCECTLPYTGPTCKDDICTMNPCLNGGTCKINGTSFQCKCKTPYSGKLCEEVIDICSKNPCENGGICRLKDNSPKCECRTPYFGDKCEKDSCTDNPCKNGGTCSLFGDSFKCNCKEQFGGDNCEQDPCTKNPCENGGTCRLKGNSTKCFCKTPYFGDKCQKDPCTNNPCKNGGTCSLNDDSFKCDCKENFIGDKCEFDLKISTIMMSTETSTQKTTTIPSTVYDMCEDGLCIHGKCEVIGQYYRCRCDEGFTGFRCEQKVQNISDKQTVWQIIQASILFSILILLSVMLCINLRRRK